MPPIPPRQSPDEPRPRITLALDPDGEFFELYMNEAGRDLLVRELTAFDARHEHIHLGPDETAGEVVLDAVPYRPDQRVLQWGKILFRLDEWDRRHFPHVMDPPASDTP